MGTKMTKELGVYNEEEKVSTPLGSHRYRVLNMDPRSASSGINRTPIQVECTPTGPKTIQRSESYTRLEDLEDIKSVEEIKADSGFKEERVMDSDTQEEIKSIVCEAEQKFLETDIDQLDSLPGTIDTVETPPQPNSQPVLELFDVRSPSLQITRTPILVECTPELFALHSRIESLSFCDVDVHDDDPSATVSESDLSPQNHQSTINNWLIGVDSQACDTPMSNSFTESPRQVARKQKELTALKKQLFFTPDVKEATKPKARTPLGDIQAGHLQHSPQKMMRAKQWRNIQDERKRRGITDTENTPPSLPPLSKISSAPGKMLDRKRSKVNWDEENTMFI